jgi:hypothetical protein
MPLMLPLIEDKSWKISQFHPDEAILALQSREGGWILAQAWQQTQYFVVNVRSHYQCSEAPPLFGKIHSCPRQVFELYRELGSCPPATVASE